MYAAPLLLCCKGLIYGTVLVAEVMPISVLESLGSSLELLELCANTYIR
jgi:hypothetical protein